MLKTILLTMVLAASAAANQQARGFCEQGAKVVVTSGVNSTTKVQASYPSCTVTVYLTGTLTLATLYSDNSNTPKANPFTANSSGYWFWYAANGHYDVTLSGGGLPSPWTISDVLLADPAAGSTTVTSVTAGPGITASPNTGAVVVSNTWGAVPTGSQLQYARLKPNTGNNTTWEVASLPALAAADYDFPAQSPSGTISIGNNLITLTPVPLGVNWNDSFHTLKVAGTGTTEACLIVAAGPGNATSGASTGTLTITCAGSHSAGFTVGSATSGGQEASVVAASLGGGQIIYAGGTFPIYGPIHPPPTSTIWIHGAGRSATILAVAATFCNPTGTPGICSLATNGVIDFSTGQPTATASDSGGFTDLTISFIQPNSATLTDYTHWPAGFYGSGGNHYTIQNVIMQRAWDGITSPNSNGVTVNNVGMSFFHRGMIFDTAFDGIVINNFEGWVFGLANNQSTLFRAISTANYALDASGVDLMQINGFATDSGKAFTFYKNGSNNVPHVQGVNIHMDSNGGFEMSNGYITLDTVSASLLPGAAGFSVAGGVLRMSHVNIQDDGSTIAAITYNPSQANAGYAAAFPPGVFIDDLQVAGTAEDQQVVYASSAGAFSGIGVVQIIGGTVGRQPGVSYTLPLFQEVAGTGTIIYDVSHVKIASNGGTAAVAFDFASANAHIVHDVDAPGGWTYTIGTGTRWFDNTGFTNNFNQIPAAMKVGAKLTGAIMVPLVGPNYIASETGSNNAIAGALLDAGAVAVPLADGLCVAQQLGHTLQSGANTYDLNSTGAKSIKSGRNPSNNIATGYAATGRIHMCYKLSITTWLDSSQ